MDGDNEPPLRDRLILPRQGRPGIFRLDSRGRPIYDNVHLRRLTSGRWRYIGPPGTFKAWVHRDGKVSFTDRAPVDFKKGDGPLPLQATPPVADPSRPHARGGGWTIGVSFLFDITDAVMRAAKQDPYGAEKLRFARATKAWRDKLRAGFRERVGKRALARFAEEAGLCRRYRERSVPARARFRRWLFSRWDETRQDVQGGRLRAAILAAIRRCAIRYPAAELHQLNSVRRSRARFSP